MSFPSRSGAGDSLLKEQMGSVTARKAQVANQLTLGKEEQSDVQKGVYQRDLFTGKARITHVFTMSLDDAA